MSKLRSSTQKSLGLEVNGPVFWSSLVFLVVSISLVLVFQESAEAFLAKCRQP